MGRAVAEAAVKAGLPLVPYTLCGAAEAAASSSVEVSGQLLKLVGPDTRDQLIEQASGAVHAIPTQQIGFADALQHAA